MDEICNALRGVQRIGFLALPDFSMVALSSAIEVLRMANAFAPRSEFSWSVITPSGETARSCDGATQARATSYRAAGKLDMVLACGGSSSASSVDDTVMVLLRQMERDGITLSGLGAGTHALAHAGLLDGYQCAVDWGDLDVLRERYPQVRARPSSFVVDRNRITCAGGIAPIDLMLSIVSIRCGAETAAEISDRLTSDARGNARPIHAVTEAGNAGFEHAALAKMVSLMENNLEDLLSLAEVARRAGISLRQAQRLFQDALGTTPAKYYLRLRVRRARELLLHSLLSIAEIAYACGFESPGHFSKSYRAIYGLKPSHERRQKNRSLTIGSRHQALFARRSP